MIIAGTGHRPPKCAKPHLPAFSDEQYHRLVALCDAALKREAEQAVEGVTAVISGMALGFDQALAAAALDRQIPLWAYLPCENQAARWARNQREWWEHLLSHASRIEFAHKGPYAPGCTSKRNQLMVRDCDKLLALWNKELDEWSGTQHAIGCAENMGKPWVNLWDSWAKYG